MKKFITEILVLLSCLILAFTFIGCSKENNGTVTSAPEKTTSQISSDVNGEVSKNESTHGTSESGEGEIVKPNSSQTQSTSTGNTESKITPSHESTASFGGFTSSIELPIIKP